MNDEEIDLLVTSGLNITLNATLINEKLEEGSNEIFDGD